MARFLYKHRRGTTDQWDRVGSDLIPLEGEIVIEIDNINGLHKLKIGDGIHNYNELKYLMAGDEIVSQVLTRTLPRIITITLESEQWNEIICETDPNIKYYGQTVNIDGITLNSRLDLQPNADMLAEFQKLNLIFVTENKAKVITVYSIGNMPTKSYTMQATIIETDAKEGYDEIVGASIGVPTMQCDWKQTDETKSDYIKNKPTVSIVDNVLIIG